MPDSIFTVAALAMVALVCTLAVHAPVPALRAQRIEPADWRSIVRAQLKTKGDGARVPKIEAGVHVLPASSP